MAIIWQRVGYPGLDPYLWFEEIWSVHKHGSLNYNVVGVYPPGFVLFTASIISYNYKARVTPPRIKDTIQQIFELITKRDFKSNTHHSLKSKISIKDKSKFRNFYLYPKFGCKGVIDFLKDDILLNNGIIKTNSIITDLNSSNDHIEIQYIQGKNVYTQVFDKIYWAASILDLINILKLKNFNQLKYRKLLTINISINKKDLLGDKVHASYIRYRIFFFTEYMNQIKLVLI